MRHHNPWALVAFLACAPCGVSFAGQAGSTSVDQAKRGAAVATGWNPEKANPYRQLFQPVAGSQAPESSDPVAAAPATPVVKCGLLLKPGDASLDPGIAARRPPPSQRFTIRGLEPPLCR